MSLTVGARLGQIGTQNDRWEAPKNLLLLGELLKLPANKKAWSAQEARFLLDASASIELHLERGGVKLMQDMQKEQAALLRNLRLQAESSSPPKAFDLNNLLVQLKLILEFVNR